MNFDLNDEQKMLGEQARALLADMTPFDRLRTLIDSDAQWDEPLWRKLAEMGFLGVTISEEHGGLGLGALDLGVIMEALGGANAAVPFMSSIVLAAEAIHLAGSKAQQAKWLPKLASGEAIATFGHAEGPGPVFATGTRLENGKLNGSKTPVADAEFADIAVVLVADGGFALVELQQSAVTRTRLESFDQLRPHYRIDFADAVAEPMPGTGKLDRLIDQAAVQAAFEAVGAADACLTMARDYANDRQIFGRPLGGYQAIKHKLADVAVATELARSNAYFGGWAAESS
ncbi:MAG: acyl-CoA/acyl-ACP dehydrogenase, partial [Sphingomonadales bacterium]|nr:acyl-CoA/acyl-ACP dehydrogenase [Sphingomonadales bacterium]